MYITTSLSVHTVISPVQLLVVKSNQLAYSEAFSHSAGLANLYVSVLAINSSLPKQSMIFILHLLALPQHASPDEVLFTKETKIKEEIIDTT